MHMHMGISYLAVQWLMLVAIGNQIEWNLLNGLSIAFCIDAYS